MKNFNYIAPLAVNEQIFFTVDTQGMIESSRYIYIYLFFRSEATFIVYELHDTSYMTTSYMTQITTTRQSPDVSGDHF